MKRAPPPLLPSAWYQIGAMGSWSLFLLVPHDIVLSPCLKGTGLLRPGLMARVFWR